VSTLYTQGLFYPITAAASGHNWISLYRFHGIISAIYLCTLNLGIVINKFRDLLLYEIGLSIVSSTHYWILNVSVDCFKFSCWVCLTEITEIAIFWDT
jgi:hypothetical protein